MDRPAERRKIQLLIEMKRYPVAIRRLGELLRDHPGEVDLQLTLAELYLIEKDTDTARKLTERAITEWPDYARAHHVRARIEMEAGCLPAAEAAAREAIRLQPLAAASIARLAQIEFSLGRYGDAGETAARALALQPENLLALNVRSRALARLGETTESDRAASAALLVGPDDPNNHYNYGWTLLEAGRAGRAIHHFETALSRNPRMARARAALRLAILSRSAGYRTLTGAGRYIRRSGSLNIIGPLSGLIGVAIVSVVKDVPWEALRPVLTFIVLGFTVLAGLASGWAMFENRILAAHPSGRTLLSERERRGSVAAVGIVGLAAVLLVYGLAADRRVAVLGACVIALLPLLRYLVEHKRGERETMLAADLLTFTLISSVVVTFTGWADVRLTAYLSLAIASGVLISRLP